MFRLDNTDSLPYLTITSLGSVELERERNRESKRREGKKGEVPTAWQQVGLLYLDDKMAASAGT